MSSYPTTLEISYSDDSSYRKCIRTIFSMAQDELSDDSDYDELITSQFINFLYKETSSNLVFLDIYKQAAASHMLSEDISIGLVVCLSYTYLQLFHKCLVVFFTDPMCDFIQNIHFIQLQQMLQKK